MKDIQYRKSVDVEHRTKDFSVTSRTEDKDSKTQVMKSFQYQVSLIEKVEPAIEPPQIYIKKSFDSVKRVEKFNFQVIGYFYMTHSDNLLEVHFHHTLDIEICWKNKEFSPKKSVILT